MQVAMASDPVDELHRILSNRFRVPKPGELHDDLDLGPSGFGLDSISLIELLIVCEDYFGCPFPYTLFDDGPLTVGRLVVHARRSSQPAAE
jgi:acyl carrier protein